MVDILLVIVIVGAFSNSALVLAIWLRSRADRVRLAHLAQDAQVKHDLIEQRIRHLEHRLHESSGDLSSITQDLRVFMHGHAQQVAEMRDLLDYLQGLAKATPLSPPTTDKTRKTSFERIADSPETWGPDGVEGR